MLELPQVTLIGVDSINIGRLLHAAEICQRSIRFGDVRILTSLPHDDPCIVSIEPITSIEAYSDFILIIRVIGLAKNELFLPLGGGNGKKNLVHSPLSHHRIRKV